MDDMEKRVAQLEQMYKEADERLDHHLQILNELIQSQPLSSYHGVALHKKLNEIRICSECKNFGGTK